MSKSEMTFRAEGDHKGRARVVVEEGAGRWHYMRSVFDPTLDLDSPEGKAVRAAVRESPDFERDEGLFLYWTTRAGAEKAAEAATAALAPRGKARRA